MTDSTNKVEADRQLLRDARAKGRGATLRAFFRLSGPGWLQSAITLGGGSLASSLYLGVVAGFAFLWVQPLAMILGIVMLSCIAYVTLSTGERPFRAINLHVNPVLGWGWALASMAANMFWCLPQYALADSVLQQNLMPDVLGPGGAVCAWFGSAFGDQSWLSLNGGKLVIAVSILIVTTLITWSYDSGRFGIKLYEWILKLMVAGIVICFVGVVYALRAQLEWGEIFAGFVPDLSKLFEPSDQFIAVLQGNPHQAFWSELIVSEQRDMIIGAAATAVGINMTFLFPYSLLAKGWGREFRGLSIFDLSTGMLIPFVLATSCVVVAAASRFHTEPVQGLLGETTAEGKPIRASEKETAEFYRILTPLLRNEIGDKEFDRLDEETEALRGRIDQLPEQDRRVAAMLIKRSPADLAHALSPLTGDAVANTIFGLGVLGMTLSTITLLMLISGFVFVEVCNLKPGGWPHRLGCLFAATGALGPFIWSEAAFYLAVYVSAFGLMLLPIAYLSFFFLMNQRRLLGDDMPRGGRRLTWNLLLFIAAGVASFASVYSVWKKLGANGLYVMAGFLALAVLVQIRARRVNPRRKAPPLRVSRRRSPREPAVRFPAQDRFLGLANAGVGPVFGLFRQPVQLPLDLAAVVLQAVAVEIWRYPQLRTNDRAGAGKRPRNGKAIPTAKPPRPVVAKSQHDQRPAQLRREVNRPRRQAPTRPARPVGRNRQVHAAAAATQFPQRRSAAAHG